MKKEEESMKKEETAVAVQNDQDFQIPSELTGVFDLKEQLEGVQPRLPQIGIVHAAQMFKMPDDSLIGQFDGIILDHNCANAWWETSFEISGGGVPPDCLSLDGITPDPSSAKRQCDTCTMCPLNQFGSDGRGKACKNMKRVHVLINGSLLPYRLTLPPSSLRAFDDYVTIMTGRKIPLQLMTTIFALTNSKNQDGIDYSELRLTLGTLTVTTKEEAQERLALRNEWRKTMRGQLIEGSEVVTAEAPAYTGTPPTDHENFETADGPRF